ncbi:MAG: hypothetical protein QOJ95_5053 [Mycobacterium sp.]|nr:hypothetical protein [Mycobacterium sp.]
MIGYSTPNRDWIRLGTLQHIGSPCVQRRKRAQPRDIWVARRPQTRKLSRRKGEGGGSGKSGDAEVRGANVVVVHKLWDAAFAADVHRQDVRAIRACQRLLRVCTTSSAVAPCESMSAITSVTVPRRRACSSRDGCPERRGHRDAVADCRRGSAVRCRPLLDLLGGGVDRVVELRVGFGGFGPAGAGDEHGFPARVTSSLPLRVKRLTVTSIDMTR